MQILMLINIILQFSLGSNKFMEAMAYFNNAYCLPLLSTHQKTEALKIPKNPKRLMLMIKIPIDQERKFFSFFFLQQGQSLTQKFFSLLLWPKRSQENSLLRFLQFFPH